jgi:protein-S-isoprenylcysteine O-methyltransferase Ste14
LLKAENSKEGFMATTAPNRVVATATAVLGLVAALAPVVADLDWTSTLGVVAGVGVVAAAALKWLDGWQKYEERTAIELGELQGLPPAEYDEDAPQPEGSVGGAGEGNLS